eukprot:348732_1
MNLLPLDDNQIEYGTITIQEKEEERKQKYFHQCSKRTSILISLLVCCILAIAVIIWFELVSTNHYGKIDSINDDNIFKRGDILTNMLMDDNIDYRQISNNDWTQLWITIGYDPQIINEIDFHTYHILGVDYKKIYMHLKENEFNQLPSFTDCECNYCLGFCQEIYCPICVN